MIDVHFKRRFCVLVNLFLLNLFFYYLFYFLLLVFLVFVFVLFFFVVIGLVWFGWFVCYYWKSVFVFVLVFSI